MGFGISFGANKSKSTTVENKDETQNTNQQTNSTSNQNTTGNTNTAQTGSTTNVGASTSSQAQSTTGAQTTTGATTGVTQNFDSTTLAGLQQLVQQLTGSSGGSAANDTLSSQLANLGKFNADDYVAGVKQSAQATADSNLDASIGASNSGIGGTESTNSAAALLGARLRSDSAASVAGQVSQAESTAASISNANVNSANSAVSTSQNYLSQLLDALKGGQSETTGATTQAGTTTGGTTTTGTTGTTESGTNASNTNTASSQNVSDVISQLLTGITTTTGTDTSTTTGKKSGGGISL